MENTKTSGTLGPGNKTYFQVDSKWTHFLLTFM